MPAVGSHVPQAKNGGTWKNWSDFLAKHNGTWKKPLSVFVKNGGSWVKVWDESPTVVTQSTSYITSGFTIFYRKTGTFNANAYESTLTATTSGSGELSIITPSPTTVAAGSTSVPFEVEVVVEDPSYDPSNFPQITITNASGSVTF